MKKTAIMLGLVLVFAVPIGGALASGRTGHSSPGDAVSSSPTENGPTIVPAGFSLCPAIAETVEVRGRGIDYLRTREFAEAVSAVANGATGYAPTTAPPEGWKDAAADWNTSVALDGKPWIAVVSEGDDPGVQRAFLVSPNGIPMEPIMFGMDRSCDPRLLYRASIEYRFRTGQENLPLLHPQVVRQAVSEIGITVMAKLDMAARSAKRADDIAARILEAEKAGAGECQPQELSRAKAELAIARNYGITELDFDPGMTEMALARAETRSGNLLAERRYAAASHRLGCNTE